MSSGVPSVLILGHLFVKHLKRVLRSHFDPRADANFKLWGTVSVHLHGVGGRTVTKLRSSDLHVVQRIAPDFLIVEIGTNDLVDTGPEVVVSEMENLVRLLLENYKVRIFCVCHVIPRGHSYDDMVSFAEGIEIFRHYLDVVPSVIKMFFFVFLGGVHRGFSHPGKDFYLPDGVHVNPAGQYHLYRSYRSAISRVLRLL